MELAYDMIMIGHVSRDIIMYQDEIQHILGGPVIYSSASAVRSGASVLVVTKAHQEDKLNVEQIIKENSSDLHFIHSSRTTSIENIYHSEDREKRTVTLLSRGDAFNLDDIPSVRTKIIHFAGLFAGEIPDACIIPLSGKGRIGIDAQGFLRREENRSLIFRDWERKRELLPYVTYFKADAAEGEIITGTADRYEAALKLTEWGAQEVMISHHHEVIVASQGRIFKSPLSPDNLTGRTGRGDTVFAAYLAKRLHTDIQSSLDFAAALVSIKLENPGPFRGSTADVLEKMRKIKESQHC